MSDKKTEQEKQIEKLRQNLGAIRKLAGWTAEDLGDKIGVTKQTISNLENNKNPMNFTQYLAIRTILDHEIANNTENTILREAVDILLDREDINEQDYEKLQEQISAIAISAAGGVAGATLTTLFTGVTGGILGAVPILGGPVVATLGAVWMNKIYVDKKKKKKK